MAGDDHVGIGSDYDGVGDLLPEGLRDVSTYPALLAEPMRRGWADRYSMTPSRSSIEASAKAVKLSATA